MSETHIFSKGFSCALVLAALLAASGCDQPPEDKPVVGQQGDVEALVGEVAQVAGESEDESAICGRLATLLAALPTVGEMDGLTESYRGCESPMTANLQYEDDQRAIVYTLSVLRAEQADLPGQGDIWQGLLDMNRQAIESLIATQQAMIDVGGKNIAEGAPDPLTREERDRLPRQLVLPNGASATLFNDGKDWTLVSLMQDRYILRVDLLGYLPQADNTAAAEKLVMARVADIDFARLP